MAAIDAYPSSSPLSVALHEALAEAQDAASRFDGALASLSCLSEIVTGRHDDADATLFTLRAVTEAADRVRSAARRAEDHIRLARGEVVA